MGVLDERHEPELQQLLLAAEELLAKALLTLHQSSSLRVELQRLLTEMRQLREGQLAAAPLQPRVPGTWAF